MKANVPRIVIGGVHSGCGKTTVTSAFLYALVRRSILPAAFKYGPDYIDPMFHTEIIGAPSRNLDLFLLQKETVCALLAENAKDAPLAVIEGAMGYYDGIGGRTDRASTHDLSMKTETPSVLVLSVKGMSLSAVAMLQGYLQFRKNMISGVILNGIRPAMYPFYREMLERETGIRVYGCLPPAPQVSLESRHLGLLTTADIQNLQEKLACLADLAEQHLDIDGLLELAHTAAPLEAAPLLVHPVCRPPVRIAIARDRAFCFYYADSLALLERMGAELVPFSPLNDTMLPDHINGLYLGGGYPELHGARLSENHTMRQAIRTAIAHGMPTLAECGGYLYLQDGLTDLSEKRWNMVGALHGEARMQTGLQNFGYVTLTAKKDNLLCCTGDSIRAHEFHYATVEGDGDAFEAAKPLHGRKWNCVQTTDTLFAGFPHLHFGANPAFAEAFLRRCDRYRKEKTP